MRKIFKEFHANSKSFWTRENLPAVISSLGYLLVALVVQKTADTYVSGINGVAVSDVLLNNLPTVDVDFFIIQGALAATFIGIFLFFYKPKYFCFGIKAFSIFLVTRSFFISLTHLGYSPDALALDNQSFGFGLFNLLYNNTNDFFFSGHTGMPLLMALVFWPEKIWRYTFIAISFILGTSVLLAHVHYSIDVFAAPFITYSIYALAKYFFAKDFDYSRKPASCQ
ncbi:MAG: phosphatase PAP2-related protein [Patescibacteria group bacterium]|jgi:hypothetical protein